MRELLSCTADPSHRIFIGTATGKTHPANTSVSRLREGLSISSYLATAIPSVCCERHVHI